MRDSCQQVKVLRLNGSPIELVTEFEPMHRLAVNNCFILFSLLCNILIDSSPAFIVFAFPDLHPTLTGFFNRPLNRVVRVSSQQNLDNWKSSRRKRVEHIIDRAMEKKKFDEEEHDRNRSKPKTFSELMEER